MKIKRNPNIRRLCLSCAIPTPEPDFPTKAWYCAACIDRPAAMPLSVQLGRDQFDTRRIFQGLKVKWVYQGGDSKFSREQVIPARLGEFYAVGENCVGFVSKSGNTANKILQQFPTVRCFSRSDGAEKGKSGEVVLHMDVDDFPAVAAAVGVRRKRVVSEETKMKLRENLKVARLARNNQV